MTQWLYAQLAVHLLPLALPLFLHLGLLGLDPLGGNVLLVGLSLRGQLAGLFDMVVEKVLVGEELATAVGARVGPALVAMPLGYVGLDPGLGQGPGREM